MSSRHVDELQAELIAELNLELDAVTDLYERTGQFYWKLNPAEQQKVVEEYREKHHQSSE